LPYSSAPVEYGEARDVPPRAGQTLDQFLPHQELGRRRADHDGSRRSGLFRGGRCWTPVGDDDINVQGDQFSRKRGQPIHPSCCRSHLEADFGIAERAHPIPKRFDVRGMDDTVRQPSDPGNLDRRLCLSRERRGDGTGQRGQQEAAAVHAGIVGRVANQVKCYHLPLASRQ
jgi:hypothetical protein